MEQTPRNAIEENGLTDIRRLTACLFLCLLPLLCQAQPLLSFNSQLQAEWKDSVRLALRESYKQKRIKMDGGEMRLHWDVFGDKPADGRSLYISLHGGGGAPAELNDSQWRNQWQLYRPEEGVYEMADESKRESVDRITLKPGPVLRAVKTGTGE